MEDSEDGEGMSEGQIGYFIFTWIVYKCTYINGI